MHREKKQNREIQRKKQKHNRHQHNTDDGQASMLESVCLIA